MNNECNAEYRRWLALATADADLAAELRAMDAPAAEDAFYRELAFGTGGLRGVLGAGTNRMNLYTVARASQGLADEVKERCAPEKRRIAVSYDSRLQSERFAETACAVFAANGIRAVRFPRLMPTPCLSYAVRALGCAAGVMITASHNPSRYNGYKVYGPDGCQITTEAAARILEKIRAADYFDGAADCSYTDGVARGLIEPVPEEVLAAYIGEVKGQSVLFGDAANRELAIVYSPLNGTGREPVLRALEESGFRRVTVVAEQALPDGRFPTCPYPNPEMPEAMALGLEYARRGGAALLLATDPDCDRVGAAVRDAQGGYRLMTGNEMGVLLLDFICGQRARHGAMPPHPVAVKTIVTTGMAARVAARYGVELTDVLTGFKFIGEQIGRLEAQGREGDYIFGFEESYGYLTGSYVRDKDGVNGALMICEMAAWYAARGLTLCDRLDELYREHGFCLDTLHSFAFEGPSGFAQMQRIMARLRAGVRAFGSRAVARCLDYAGGLNGLPASDVLQFELAGGDSVVVRPSGTEPKLKAYLSVTAESREAAQAAEAELSDAVRALTQEGAE